MAQLRSLLLVVCLFGVGSCMAATDAPALSLDGKYRVSVIYGAQIYIFTLEVYPFRDKNINHVFEIMKTVGDALIKSTTRYLSSGQTEVSMESMKYVIMQLLRGDTSGFDGIISPVVGNL